MRIAVSSQNFKNITGHAGKSRRFLVYDLAPGQAPIEQKRLDLPKEMSLHAYHGPDHPLYQLQLDAILTGGAGERFCERMAEPGIQVMMTAETDIASALAAIASGQPLPPAAPHEH